ncbi:class I SAM-dependent methyltransferase [Pseudobutyrivibrio xylanivorans]|uniref:Methyltransferase domain-containing protein n=1 Tax=Pseudobutyrivibrio xylanivorans TaxID=185007 RepID=A0A1G5S4F4_PSEXY|nr:class I SAM-dependent methyltransferase [Pseudobutyrivibrio xylanivorans]SCZ81203.1 Methyltransferase domain-containing protein [Pseudobutyrivibrio xylanivorans]
MDFLKKEKWQKLDDGIYVLKKLNINTAFSNEQQDELLTIEDTSWWFQYRASVILGLMDKYFKKEEFSADIGGGNGYTTSIAMKEGYKIGVIEPSMEACKHARDRGLKNIYCGSVDEDSIKDDSLKQVLLLDVLEHIEDDCRFLDMLYRKLSYGGCCIITVPAFMCLWSSEDEAAGHYRRYKMKSLCNILEQSRFEICYKSYFMEFLFVPIFIVRVLFEKMGFVKKKNERTPEECKRIYELQFKKKEGIINTVLSMLEILEKLLMKSKLKVLFGSSILVVVRKKHNINMAGKLEK